eukprot:jgi/Mesvir1/20858/Mv07945-RA.1
MALRQFASRAAQGFGVRTVPSSHLIFPLASRAYSTVKEGLKYAASHEWIKIEGNVGTVGISDHAQAELGDVVFVELPEVGRVLKQKETFGVVESVKAASDVYAPVGGKVIEVNKSVVDTPVLVNSDPYGKAWMMKIEISNPSEVKSLLEPAAYKKSCDEH